MKFGLDSTSLITRIASGSYSDVYNGVDVTVNARLGRGAFVQGGLNTGREKTTSCDPVDSPSGSVGIVPQPAGSSAATLTTRSVNPTSFCAVTPPLWHPQWKFSGSYPLPYGFQMSAVLQSLPGIPKLASLVVGNDIIAPMTVFEDRLNQLDVRFIRNFRISGMRIQGTLDIYNAFNEAAVLAENYQFGATWRSPLSVRDARIFKVGVQMNF